MGLGVYTIYFTDSKHHPRTSNAALFAQKTLDFIRSMNPLPFIEIHTGRTLADPLRQLFDEHNIPYRLYGEGVPLGMKPSYYENLIEEEGFKRKLKEIQREEWHITSLIRYYSPEEASELVTKFSSKAHLYRIEENIEELKRLLGALNQKRKDAKKALRLAEDVMKEDGKLSIKK